MTNLDSSRYPLIALLLLLACQPALAAAVDEDEETPEPFNASWALAGSTEVDQQSNRGAEVEIGYALTPTTRVRVGADSVAFSATQSNGFHSNGVELGAAHDFKHWTVSGSVGTWQDSDIVTAKEGKLGVDLNFRPWSIGLRGLYRSSAFESLAVDTTVTLRDGSLLPVHAVSKCKLTNQGVGAHGEFVGAVWGAHATFMSYSYKNGNCSYGSATGLDLLLHPNHDEFVQLEATLVDQMSVAGVRRIGYQNTLLSSLLEGGVSWTHNDLIVSLNIAHQAEYFSTATSNTLAATGTADMGHNSGVDVTIGYTRGDTVSSGAFVGFGFRAHF